MRSYKEVHFKVMLSEWSEFFRVFPSTGERTAFFRECMREAIRLGPESRFVNVLKRRIEGEDP